MIAGSVHFLISDNGTSRFLVPPEWVLRSDHSLPRPEPKIVSKYRALSVPLQFHQRVLLFASFADDIEVWIAAALTSTLSQGSSPRSSWSRRSFEDVPVLGWNELRCAATLLALVRLRRPRRSPDVPSLEGERSRPLRATAELFAPAFRRSSWSANCLSVLLAPIQDNFPALRRRVCSNNKSVSLSPMSRSMMMYFGSRYWYKQC